jgi:hypothetical protein
MSLFCNLLFVQKNSFKCWGDCKAVDQQQWLQLVLYSGEESMQCNSQPPCHGGGPKTPSSADEVAPRKLLLRKLQWNKQTNREGGVLHPMLAFPGKWKLPPLACRATTSEKTHRKKKRSHQFGQKTCPQVVVQIGNWRTNKLGISAESPFFASWILVEARIWEKLKALEGDRCGSSWASGGWRW